MNFFERQQQARRKTRVLLFEYGCAVAAVACAYYVGARFLVFLAAAPLRERDSGWLHAAAEAGRFALEWNPVVFVCTVTLVLLVVLVGGVWRLSSLRGGGAAVVRSFGGIEILGDTRRAHERRLLNVVEELALASGTPAPRAFVLSHERGINAFAAGFAPSDAVIAVTRGAMEQLSRDELQGLLAHEFSHIRNGDTSLNCWLIGVLHGILCFSILGKRMMDGPFGGDEEENDKVSVLFMYPLFAGGCFLRAVGTVGAVSARIIQCSVSRQREYLADAFAVQLTRDALGLANALKRAGAAAGGNALLAANGCELSHLLFVSGSSRWQTDLLSPHPPLLRRIRILDPSFNGDFAPWRLRTTTFEDLRNTPERIQAREWAVVASANEGGLVGVSGFLEGLPAELRRAVSHPFEAVGVLCGLLLSDDAALRNRQKSRILVVEGHVVANQAERWHDWLASADRRFRRRLAELAIEGVRQSDPALCAACAGLLRELIASDGKVSLFEYLLGRRIAKRLEVDETSPSPCAEFVSGRSAQIEASLVLGALAYAGRPDDDVQAQAAWRSGRDLLPGFDLGEMVPVRESCASDGLERALAVLAQLSPAEKGAFVAACTAVVERDACRSEDEAELLMVIADMLGVPLPFARSDAQ